MLYILTLKSLWRGERGRRKQEKNEDLFENEHRVAVMTVQNNLRPTKVT
jgi:hypothetical protein